MIKWIIMAIGIVIVLITNKFFFEIIGIAMTVAPQLMMEKNKKSIKKLTGKQFYKARANRIGY